MPIELEGNWKKGFALDLHTQSSEYAGVSPSGHDAYNTTRTEIGELLYQLKYRSDVSKVAEIVKHIMTLGSFKKMDCIIPVPPSNLERTHQPVFLVGDELSKVTGVPIFKDGIIKTKATPQLKSITAPIEREKLLAVVFSVNQEYDFSEKNVLLLDDLYRSGTTLRAITSVLNEGGHVKNVYVLTLTKTRSNR